MQCGISVETMFCLEGVFSIEIEDLWCATVYDLLCHSENLCITKGPNTVLNMYQKERDK